MGDPLHSVLLGADAQLVTLGQPYLRLATPTLIDEALYCEREEKYNLPSNLNKDEWGKTKVWSVVGLKSDPPRILSSAIDPFGPSIIISNVTFSTN